MARSHLSESGCEWRPPPAHICNLATVCGGCDDVFLQGDKFRVDVGELKWDQTPQEQQLLTWIQKRGLFRSDWLLERFNEQQPSNYELTTGALTGRLGTFLGQNLLVEHPTIAGRQDFSVYQINYCHPAVYFCDDIAVRKHNRLGSYQFVDEAGEDADLVAMTDRFVD